jgi:hypothetical protein
MSIRFEADGHTNLAQVDEILCRGDRQAFALLIETILHNPDGAEAKAVRILFERRSMNFGDPEFFAADQYRAAFWLTEAMKVFP